MNVKIKKSFFEGEVYAIPSKSYAHRIAICNFLAGNKPTSGSGNFSSKDIVATEECLVKLLRGEKILDCNESGSTLRFLMPLCAVLGGEYEFVGRGKLMQRPNEELFKVFNEHGVVATKDKTIKIKGKLTSGEYSIRGDISSQYISGLLMALPKLDGDSRITLVTPLASAPYVDITIEVLKNFGVKILRDEKGFYIPGSQNYSGSVLPEGDWSNAAFFLVAGAINGDVTYKGLNLNSVQGDKYILEILKMANANVDFANDTVKVKKSILKEFSFDAESCPDVVPIASVLAAFADGKSVIRNIERLKIKESDRVDTTIKTLGAFGVRAECDGKDLIVFGGKHKCGKADSFNDHRIAMSAAVMASCIDGESEITNAQAVAKSYPNFFEDFINVGGNVEYV